MTGNPGDVDVTFNADSVDRLVANLRADMVDKLDSALAHMKETIIRAIDVRKVADDGCPQRQGYTIHIASTETKEVH